MVAHSNTQPEVSPAGPARETAGCTSRQGQVFVQIPGRSAVSRSRAFPVPAASSFDAERALSECLRIPSARFRSLEQREAMVAIAERRSDLAIVLRTGCGKTAVAMGPILNEKGYTLWIAPLRALLSETKHRLQKAGIQVCKPETASSRVQAVGNVLLVGPEDIAKVEVYNAVFRLDRAKLLNRIVLDEAHLVVLGWHYRPCLSVIQALQHTRVECPRVLLTATAPPGLLDYICTGTGVERGGLEVIRGDPCRPELKLTVCHLNSGEFQDLVQKAQEVVLDFITANAMGEEEPGRILVACLTRAHSEALREEIKSVAACVDVLKHNSDMGIDEKADELKRWYADLDGAPARVMCATEGFCTGTDTANIRRVIIAGASRSVSEFWQAAGRGGRDGKACQVITLFHPSYHNKLCGKYDENGVEQIGHEARGDWRAWALNTEGECRRRSLESFLTGLQQYSTCVERYEGGMRDIQLCDVCDEKNPEFSRDHHAQGPLDVQGGELVRVGERHIPTQEQLRIAVHLREGVARKFTQQLFKMKAFGVKLRKLCLHCVARNMCGNQDPIRARERYREESRWCNGGKCKHESAYCWRCMQRGHFTRNCNVLQSVLSFREAHVS